MGSAVTGYPHPAETPTNSPLLAAWRRGVLSLQRCRACGHVFFYPRPVCPRCWSDDLAWGDAAGTGRIVSFSVIHRPMHPAFDAEAPIVLAEIALPEGPSLLARVVCADPVGVRSNAAVRLVELPEAARYPLPTFRLEAE